MEYVVYLISFWNAVLTKYIMIQYKSIQIAVLHAGAQENIVMRYNAVKMNALYCIAL